tara:strand:- start:52 stop:273 length:222 start_codon:yes stop_codon:yes gene_type:complete
MAKSRIIKALIDTRVIELTSLVDDMINDDYTWIDTICKENEVGTAEYFEHYASKVREYLMRPSQGNNGTDRVR